MLDVFLHAIYMLRISINYDAAYLGLWPNDSTATTEITLLLNQIDSISAKQHTKIKALPCGSSTSLHCIFFLRKCISPFCFLSTILRLKLNPPPRTVKHLLETA